MLPPPVPWVGWYDAIADLVPSLPDSQFAPWQLERLRDYPYVNTMYGAGGYNGDIVSVTYKPAFTVTANTNQVSQIRAFIVDDQNNGAERDNGKRGLTLRNDAVYSW